MGSLLQAVGAIPFLALAALTAGLSLAPGLYVFSLLQAQTAALTAPLSYVALGLSVVLGYITYGFSLLVIAPALNLLLGGRLKPYRGRQVSLGILRWYVHAT